MGVGDLHKVWEVRALKTKPDAAAAWATLDRVARQDEDSSDDDDDDAGAAPRRSGRKDRRHAVRIAWEKLVRWSRSWRRRNRSDVLESTRKVMVLGGGSFETAMAAHVAANKADLEVAMLLRDDLVCRSINNTHINWLVTSAACLLS
ncbi:hypothetical protein BDA96_01G262000 [Sorghum bicolor]|uniref:Glycerol-3-phosphate dehydrogenase NAD-dependent N-terminal domain-containing protein n=2 Tax=Sorghum bicolor TaxID=4558 RepID=A0A921V1C4_SORBI|nr:hypothetical protein BDA96_01G262000 [Sorghum bicolor]KXG38522.1 hypothetical protein SORBI_3001G247500 [Sorghum bicolor]